VIDEATHHPRDGLITKREHDPERGLLQLFCEGCGEHTLIQDPRMVERLVRLPDKKVICPRCARRRKLRELGGYVHTGSR
jgi:hypothetical protein